MNNKILLNYVKQTSSVGGEDLSKYFLSTLTNGNSGSSGVNYLIKEIPDNVTISGTNGSYLFYRMINLIKIPDNFSTTGVENFSSMFDNCQSLVDIPVLDTSSATNFRYFVNSCPSLSNDSLNNIMKMAINATNYNSTKTLKNMGLSSEQATICQGLSNYSDFIEAGWSTGY